MSLISEPRPVFSKPCARIHSVSRVSEFVSHFRHVSQLCCHTDPMALISDLSASCAVVKPWEAFIIGGIGALFTIAALEGLDRLGADDPVGAVATHASAGAWVSSV